MLQTLSFEAQNDQLQCKCIWSVVQAFDVRDAMQYYLFTFSLTLRFCTEKAWYRSWIQHRIPSIYAHTPEENINVRAGLWLMADGGEEKFFFYMFLVFKEIKTELVFISS